MEVGKGGHWIIAAHLLNVKRLRTIFVTPRKCGFGTHPFETLDRRDGEVLSTIARISSPPRCQRARHAQR